MMPVAFIPLLRAQRSNQESVHRRWIASVTLRVASQ
jgi:hypothetical protein